MLHGLVIYLYAIFFENILEIQFEQIKNTHIVKQEA